MKELALGVFITFCAIFALMFVSVAVFPSEQFTATVTDIQYYGQGGFDGGDKVQVSFDDGRVYSLDSIPTELKVNCSYFLEYTKVFPYEMTLIILEELERKD